MTYPLKVKLHAAGQKARKKVNYTLQQAMNGQSGNRGIIGKVHPFTGTESLYRLYSS
jgi:hypothetical protein